MCIVNLEVEITLRVSLVALPLVLRWSWSYSATSKRFNRDSNWCYTRAICQSNSHTGHSCLHYSYEQKGRYEQAFSVCMTTTQPPESNDAFRLETPFTILYIGRQDFCINSVHQFSARYFWKNEGSFASCGEAVRVECFSFCTCMHGGEGRKRGGDHGKLSMLGQKLCGHDDHFLFAAYISCIKINDLQELLICFPVSQSAETKTSDNQIRCHRHTNDGSLWSYRKWQQNTVSQNHICIVQEGWWSHLWWLQIGFLQEALTLSFGLTTPCGSTWGDSTKVCFGHLMKQEAAYSSLYLLYSQYWTRKSNSDSAICWAVAGLLCANEGQADFFGKYASCALKRLTVSLTCCSWWFDAEKAVLVFFNIYRRRYTVKL